MDNLLRLRHLRYRQTPMFLKRVKVHAIRREPSTSVLETFFENFADFQMARIKSGRSSYMSFIFISAHRHHSFIGFNIYLSIIFRLLCPILKLDVGDVVEVLQVRSNHYEVVICGAGTYQQVKFAYHAPLVLE